MFYGALDHPKQLNAYQWTLFQKHSPPLLYITSCPFRFCTSVCKYILQGSVVHLAFYVCFSYILICIAFIVLLWYTFNLPIVLISSVRKLRLVSDTWIKWRYCWATSPWRISAQWNSCKMCNKKILSLLCLMAGFHIGQKNEPLCSAFPNRHQNVRQGDYHELWKPDTYKSSLSETLWNPVFSGFVVPLPTNVEPFPPACFESAAIYPVNCQLLKVSVLCSLIIQSFSLG